MKEPELNSENESPQEKRVGHSPAADFTDREELNQELREAITKMTGKNTGNNEVPGTSTE